MHGFRSDREAVSEIVGALMLILIVFAAASSFAIFVDAKQKQHQEQQVFDQDRRLERLEILAIDPVFNDTAGDRWKEVNVTIVSLHLKPSYLSSLAVNGEPLQTWTLWRMDAGTGDLVKEVHDRPQELKVEPRERFSVQVNLTHDGYIPIRITETDGIEIEVSTWLGNRFSGAYLPPVALAFVETEPVWNGTAYETVLVLDGSRSEALYGASLVSWSWEVQPDGLELHGRKVRAPLAELGASHTIRLTVGDHFGMRDTTQITYYH